MKFSTIDMPASWSSYLINGDASGLEPGEATHIDAYLAKEGIRSVLGCSEDSHFSWSFDLHGGQYSGGDLCEYTIESFATGKESGA